MKIYVVYPYALNLGVLEKEAVKCDDGRMMVHEVKDGFECREWFTDQEYHLTSKDALEHAKAIRDYRMAQLKTEYEKLANLSFD